MDGRALQLAGLLAIDAAPGFEPVTLSPVAPAGVNTVLGGLDQNLSLATVRGGEVLADPTTSLALEAALRRRAGEASVRLCWVGRVLRMQRFGGGWNQHFGLFALVSGGRRQPDHGFGLAALHEHIAAHLRVIAALAEAGHDAGRPIVEVSDSGPAARALPRARADLDDLADQARDDDLDPEQLLAESGVAVERFAERVEGSPAAGAGARSGCYAPARERPSRKPGSASASAGWRDRVLQRPAAEHRRRARRPQAVGGRRRQHRLDAAAAVRPGRAPVHQRHRPGTADPPGERR